LTGGKTASKVLDAEGFIPVAGSGSSRVTAKAVGARARRAAIVGRRKAVGSVFMAKACGEGGAEGFHCWVIDAAPAGMLRPPVFDYVECCRKMMTGRPLYSVDLNRGDRKPQRTFNLAASFFACFTIHFLPKTIMTDAPSPSSVLEKHLRTLGVPLDLLHGVRPTMLEIPREIVVFFRATPEDAKDRGPHMHARFILCHCLRGAATLAVDGELVSMGPGEALLLFPFERHWFHEFQGKNNLWAFVTFDLPAARLLLNLVEMARQAAKSAP